MDILFISYADVSPGRGSVRAQAMLRALADAGHKIDLAAPAGELPAHSNIRVLAKGRRGRAPGRPALRRAAARAVRKKKYDVVHAVDEAVFWAAGLGRRKRRWLVYDATRCFVGRSGIGSSFPWRFFPKWLRKREAKVLARVDLVFSPCTALINELRGIDRDATVVKLEDIPAQPLYKQDVGPSSGAFREGIPAEPLVLGSVLPGSEVGLRTMLLAARKVVDAEPGARFLFFGVDRQQGEKLAANLDISGRCSFLPFGKPKTFLGALGRADAILLLPPGQSCYIHPQVYTLLQAGVPLVAVRDSAFNEVLTEETCVRVLPSVDAMAEGILRVLGEPLFSHAIAHAGQQLAARHTFSSFKHQVRMAYHQLGQKEE